MSKAEFMHSGLQHAFQKVLLPQPGQPVWKRQDTVQSTLVPSPLLCARSGDIFIFVVTLDLATCFPVLSVCALLSLPKVKGYKGRCFCFSEHPYCSGDALPLPGSDSQSSSDLLDWQLLASIPIRTAQVTPLARSFLPTQN